MTSRVSAGGAGAARRWYTGRSEHRDGGEKRAFEGTWQYLVDGEPTSDMRYFGEWRAEEA